MKWLKKCRNYYSEIQKVGFRGQDVFMLRDEKFQIDEMQKNIIIFMNYVNIIIIGALRIVLYIPAIKVIEKTLVELGIYLVTGFSIFVFIMIVQENFLW